MNFKTTFVLLVVVVAGGALWMFSGEKPAEESQDQNPGAEARYVFSARPSGSDITRLVIEQPDKPRLVFERPQPSQPGGKPEEWGMVEPLASPTESYMVNGIVTMLVGLQYAREFKPGEGGVGLAEAGLQPPQATFAIVDKSGKEYKLEIGKKAPLSNDTYVHVAGAEPIMVTQRDLSPDLKKQAADFRGKSLIRGLKRDNARRITIEHDGKKFELSRSADGEWVIDAPVKMAADSKKVQDMLIAFSAMRVESFVEDAPKSLVEYGLETPYVRMEVTTEEDKVVTSAPASQGAESQPIEPKIEKETQVYRLAIGDFADIQASKRFVKLPDQPWVAIADKAGIERITPKLSELRDPKVARIKADAVDEITLEQGAERIVVVREDGEWKREGGGAAVEVEAIESLTHALEELSAIDTVDAPESPEKYGLDKPRATITVSSASSLQPVTLHIGGATPSGVNTYVQVEGQSFVQIVASSQAERLAISPLALRARSVFSLDPAHITSIEVKRPDKRYALSREAGSWRLDEPAGAPLDTGAARDMANDLARLRATTYVSSDDLAKLGLDPPALEISFSVQPQPASQPTSDAAQSQAAPVAHVYSLRLGHVDGRTYGQKGDEEGVFELDKSVWQTLSGELLERGLFKITEEDVTWVKVSAPGGALDFALRDGQWVFTPDPSVQLAQKKVKEFVSALVALRVSAYLAYNEGDLAAEGLEEAPVTVEIILKDKPAITLKIDQVRRGELPRKAAWVEQRRIFLLRPGDAEMIFNGLDHYLKPAGPEAPAAPGQAGAAGEDH